MKLDVGKYRGRDLGDVPTDYLEWALGHLALSDGMAAAVTAEYSRRTHEARVRAETPAQRAFEGVSRTVTRFLARRGIRIPLPGLWGRKREGK